MQPQNEMTLFNDPLRWPSLTTLFNDPLQWFFRLKTWHLSAFLSASFIHLELIHWGTIFYILFFKKYSLGCVYVFIDCMAKVNILQKRILYKSEYSSKVDIFQKWIFSKNEYSLKVNILCRVCQHPFDWILLKFSIRIHKRGIHNSVNINSFIEICINEYNILIS